MPETGHSSESPARAPEDLDQRVQALLAEIDDAAARIERAATDEDEKEPGEAPALEDAAAPEAEAQAPAASAATDREPEAAGAPGELPVAPFDEPLPGAEAADVARVEEFAEPQSAEARATEDELGAGREEARSLEALDADLEEDLDRLLAQEGLEGEPAPGSADARAEPDDGARRDGSPEPDLEAQLEELLRDGEITAPAMASAPEQGRASALDQELAELRDEDLTDKAAARSLRGSGSPPSQPTWHEDAGAEAPAEAPDPPESAGPALPATAAARLEVARHALSEMAVFARRTAPQVAARVEPAAHRVATVVSRPLAQRPSHVRQIVGWLAVYTGILAACVWLYLLFFRAAPASGPDDRAPAIVGAPQDK